MWLPIRVLALAVTIALLAHDRPARAESPPEACPATRVEGLFEGRLPRLARRWQAGAPLRIVALGSSSTAGAGASTPRGSYPAQLEQALKRRWPDREIVVINAGINGNEASDMLARVERDVLAHAPDLVLWQFGSNGVLRGVPPENMEAAARAGIARMHAANADVVLIDLQHAPRIDEGALRDAVLAMIGSVARGTGAARFQRYRLMRAWDERLGADYRRMLLEDRLHLNDFSYRCLAEELARALDEELTRSPDEARLN